jgi:hypothetical protein
MLGESNMKEKKTLTAPGSESSIYGLGKAYGELLPGFSFALSELEPIVYLLVGVSSIHRKNLQKSGMQIPVPVKIRALIDTGFSGGIMINETCVREFGLKAMKFNKIDLPLGKEEHYFAFYAYDVDVSITFLNPSKGGTNVLIDPVSATLVEFTNSASGAQALIGQGILRACVFTYDGECGVCKLTF